MFKKFFFDMVTLLESRLTVHPIILSRLPHSVFSSATADGPNSPVHTFLASTRSSAMSSSKHDIIDIHFDCTLEGMGKLPLDGPRYSLKGGWSARPLEDSCDLKVYKVTSHLHSK